MSEKKETKEIVEMKEKLSGLLKQPESNLIKPKDNGEGTDFPMRSVMSKIFPFAIRKGSTSLKTTIVIEDTTFYIIVNSSFKKQDIFGFFNSETIKKYISRNAKSPDEAMPLPTVEEGFPLYLKLVSMCSEENKSSDGNYYVDISLKELQYKTEEQKITHTNAYESIIYQLMTLYSDSITIWAKDKKQKILGEPEQLITGLKVSEKDADSTKQYVRVYLNPRFIPYIGTSYIWVPEALFTLSATAIVIFIKLKPKASKILHFKETDLFEMIGLRDIIRNKRITIKKALESLKQIGFIINYEYSNQVYTIEKNEGWIPQDKEKELDSPDAMEITEENSEENIFFNKEKLSFEGITEQKLKKWKEAFPNCNVDIELKKMEAWLIANSTKRKKNYEKFIVNWLGRARGGNNGKNNGRYIPVSGKRKFTGLDADAGKW